MVGRWLVVLNRSYPYYYVPVILLDDCWLVPASMSRKTRALVRKFGRYLAVYRTGHVLKLLGCLRWEVGVDSRGRCYRLARLTYPSRHTLITVSEFREYILNSESCLKLELGKPARLADIISRLVRSNNWLGESWLITNNELVYISRNDLVPIKRYLTNVEVRWVSRLGNYYVFMD